MIKHICTPYCIYFHKDNKEQYYFDENNLKHNKATTSYCYCFNKNIGSWNFCENYFGMKKPIDEKKIVVLLGKSATGKDTVINYFVDKFGFLPLISTTTRPMRKGETEGKDYYFINDEEFNAKKEQFFDIRKYETLYNGVPKTWYYGITKTELSQKFKFGANTVICAVDIVGYKNLVEHIGKENLLTIYIDAKEEIRKQRAVERGSFSITEWDRRARDDDKVFELKNLYGVVDYICTNNCTKQNLFNEFTTIFSREGQIVES